jgi:hypothetical protein
MRSSTDANHQWQVVAPAMLLEMLDPAEYVPEHSRGELLVLSEVLGTRIKGSAMDSSSNIESYLRGKLLRLFDNR